MRQFKMAKTTGKHAEPMGSYSLEFALPTARSFDEIWGALTKPDKLAEWLSPVAGKLSKGGAFDIGAAAKGTITQCDPKRRLGLTLTQGTAQSQIEITFAEEGKGKSKARMMRVKVTAQMSDLPPATWQRFGPATLGIGWELAAAALLDYVANPKAARAAGAILAYAPSAEGIAFTEAAWEGWRAAAKEGGLDLPAAPAPALLQFYNGLHR